MLLGGQGGIIAAGQGKGRRLWETAGEGQGELLLCWARLWGAPLLLTGSAWCCGVSQPSVRAWVWPGEERLFGSSFC